MRINSLTATKMASLTLSGLLIFGGAVSADGYTDNHLSRSKRLLDIERAYDEGRNASRDETAGDGVQHQTRPQVHDREREQQYGGSERSRDPVERHADEVSERIISEAEAKAQEVMSKENIDEMESTLDPDEIMNEPVGLHIKSGNLLDIVRALSPEGWSVDHDIEDEKVLTARYNFTADTSRQQAFNDLLSPLGLQAKFFFNLRDAQGRPAPLVLVK